MSVDAVDEALALLDGAVTAQAAMLLELESSPGRVLLDPAQLTGTSQKVASITLSQLAEAWRAFAALKDVVEQAKALRAQRLDARRLATLDMLLHGCSVPEVLSDSHPRRAALPPGPTPPGPTPPGPTPPDYRFLAEARTQTSPGDGSPSRGTTLPRPTAVAARRPRQAGGMLRPDELARRADRVLRGVQRTIRFFTETFNSQLSRLAHAQQAIETLVADAERVGAGDEPALAIARRLLTVASATAAADPLSVLPADIARLDAALASAVACVADLVRRRDSLDTDLRDAAALLDGIVALADAGLEAAERTCARIARPGTLLRLDDGWLDDRRRGLRPWLDRLRALAAAGRWREASLGLARWRELAETTRATAAQVVEINSAPLHRRDELRGLFGAWEAKAAALGLAQESALAELGHRARRELYTAPTDVDEAAQQVSRYAAALDVLADRQRAGGPLRRHGHGLPAATGDR